MIAQIIGKIRLELTALQNHWWNVPLYVTSRGIMTGPMPVTGGRWLDIELDLMTHEVVCRTNESANRAIELRARPVADFFAELTSVLTALDIDVPIDRMPVECLDPIRFDLDRVHASYDSNAVGRFWRTLAIADTLLKRFSANFYGKISPVHFFWGSFDLAVTRFSGRSAPRRQDPIQNEAYSHEVISMGFWPGNGGYGHAAFYAYAAPSPAGLDKVALSDGRYDAQLGEFVLDYEVARNTTDPVDAVLQFFAETYSAAADLAGWDRRILDRHDEVASAVRLTEPQSSHNVSRRQP